MSRPPHVRCCSCCLIHVAFPDFLTPNAQGDIEAGLEAALSTPDERLRAELGPFECLAWTRDPDRVRDVLRGAVHAYRRAVFAAHWAVAAAGVVTDRAIRSTMLAEGGVDLLLATLHPDIDWTYPVLTPPCSDKLDYHLHGQVCASLHHTSFLDLPSIIDRPDAPLEVHYRAGRRARHQTCPQRVVAAARPLPPWRQRPTRHVDQNGAHGDRAGAGGRCLVIGTARLVPAMRLPEQIDCRPALGSGYRLVGQRLVMMVVTGSSNRRSARWGRSARSQRERCRGSVATMISSKS